MNLKSTTYFLTIAWLSTGIQAQLGHGPSEEIDHNAEKIIEQVLEVMDSSRNTGAKLDLGRSRCHIVNGKLHLPEEVYEVGYTYIIANRCILANGLRWGIIHTHRRPDLQRRLLAYFKPLRQSLLLDLQELHRVNADWTKTGVVADSGYYPGYEYAAILEFLTQDVSASNAQIFQKDGLYSNRDEVFELAQHAFKMIADGKGEFTKNSSLYITCMIASAEYLDVFDRKSVSSEYSLEELVNLFGVQNGDTVELFYGKKEVYPPLRIHNTSAMLGAAIISPDQGGILEGSANIRDLSEYELSGKGYDKPYFAAKSFSEAARCLPYLKDVDLRARIASRFSVLLLDRAQDVNIPYNSGGVGVPADRKTSHLGFLLQTSALVLARNDAKRTAQASPDFRRITLTSSQSVPEDTTAMIFFRSINGSRCRWSDVRHSVSGRISIEKSTADLSSVVEEYSFEVKNSLFHQSMKSGTEFDLWLVNSKGDPLENVGIPITPE